MTRVILFLLWLTALNSFGAAGDPLWFAVSTNGWSGRTCIEGFGAGGDYNYGISTNTVTGAEIYSYPTTTKLQIIIDTPGYINGSATVLRWTNFGTVYVSKPTPNEAQPAEEVLGSDVVLVTALSRPVATADTIVEARVLAGFYTDTGASSTAILSGSAVTNYSTTGYPQVGGNWDEPGWQCWSNSGVLSVWAGEPHSASLVNTGALVDCVWFIARKASTLVGITNIVSVATTNTPFIGLPYAHYATNMAITAFSDGENVRCDFIVFPRYGTNILDTTRSQYIWPASVPCSITNRIAKTAYSGFLTQVAPGGSDTSGRAFLGTDPNAQSISLAFATIAGANNRLAESNNIYPTITHNDSGGGIIYVRSNNVAFAGATVTATTKPDSWTIIRPFPGTNVAIMNDTGTDDLNDRVKFEGHYQGGTMVFSNTSTQIPFSSMDALWLDRCIIKSAGVGPFQMTLAYLTSCWITNLTQGLRAVGTANQTFALVKDCNLDGFNNTWHYATALGNVHPGNNGSNYIIVNDYSSGQAAPNDWAIFFNNGCYGFRANGNSFAIGVNKAITNGVWVGQNIFEFTTNSLAVGSSASYDIASINTLGYTNVNTFHNLFLGARNFIHYNDVGSAAAYRVLCSLYGNVFTEPAYKSDTFVTANANRTGNWAVIYGNASSGNVARQLFNISTTPTFLPRWPGPGALFRTTTVTYSWPQFYGDGSYSNTIYTAVGGPGSPGSGDYRVHNTSPMVSGNTPWFLPYDYMGRPRTRANTIAGPFALNREAVISGGTTTINPATTTTIQP